MARDLPRKPRPLVPAGAAPGSTPAGRWDLRDLAGLALLVAFLGVAFHDAFQLPFLNDDYTFLERTRDASFASLWSFRRLAFQWYRPWSRDLHFWWLQRWFGPSEPVFHLANLVLGLVCLILFAILVRRIAGRRASAWAVAAAAALSPWGALLRWASGSQDLWMMLWALLALQLWVNERRRLALAAFVLALLSKETACMLPAIALAWDRLGARRDLRSSLRRVAPMMAISLTWAALHPHLGGRLWHQVELPAAPPQDRIVPALALLRSLLASANLDVWPHPGASWAIVFLGALLPVVLLIALAWTRWSPDAGTVEPRRIAAFGGAWALLSWLPQALPGLGWHAFYALFGALGALLAAAPWITRQRALALGTIALLGVLSVARTLTPTSDWGEAAYLMKIGASLHGIRASLTSLHPDFPVGSRLYFGGDPDALEILAGNGPSVRVWYRDPTLRGGRFAAYRPRGAGDDAGRDYFFRLDPAGACTELVNGPEDVTRAQQTDAHWIADQQELALVLANAGDWRGAAGCYQKLSEARPDVAEFPYRAAFCLFQRRDSVEAVQWLRRAGALPGASQEMRAAVARMSAAGRGR